jgi:predicted dehydrogenase
VRATAGSEKLKFVRGIDIAPDPAREFCAEYGLELSSDYADALNDPDIDAVFLATPHSLHADQIVAAAAAGKHAFTEKPFALRKSDGARAAEAAEAAGIQLGLGHNYRYVPALWEIKQLVDAGKLGELHHLEANLSHDGQLGIETWRRSADEAPTGGIIHFGAHMIDLLCWYAGEMEEVYGQTATHLLDDDVGAVLFKFQSGTMGYLADLMATPAMFYFNVMGDKGWARVQGWLDNAQLTICYTGGQPEAVDLAPRGVDAQIRANDENFAAACEGTEPYLFTPQHMVHTAAIQEAIADSVKSGAPVAVA